MHRCYRGWLPVFNQGLTRLGSGVPGTCMGRLGTRSAEGLARGEQRTRHSSVDDGCLQQENPKERLSLRFYYASSSIRDVLAENRSASRRTKNP